MAYVLFAKEEVTSSPGITILDTSVTGSDPGDADALEVAVSEMQRVMDVLSDESDPKLIDELMGALSDLAEFIEVSTATLRGFRA
jgi:hypothetical protein